MVRTVYSYSLENLFKHFMSSVNSTKLQYKCSRTYNIIHIEHFYNTLCIIYLSSINHVTKCNFQTNKALFNDYF